MAYTVSIVVGKGCTAHNNRTIKNKSSSERSWDPSKKNTNHVYVDVPIQKKYHELFDDSLKKYNAKQNREDRKIKNYYEKISRSKQEKPYREMIVSIGDIDCLKKGSADEDAARIVLDRFAKTFEKRNPNFKLFQCIMHNDEKGVPHLHIDFIPISKNNKRGLATKNSMSGALSQMGYKGRDGFSEWREAQLDTIKGFMADIDLDYTESLKPRLHGSLPKEQYIQYDNDLKKIESIKTELKEVESKQFDINDINIPQKKLLGNRVMVDVNDLNQLLEQNKSYVMHKDELKQLPEMHKQLDERIETIAKLENQSQNKIEQNEKESKNKIERAELKLNNKIKITEADLRLKIEQTNLSLEEKEKDLLARSKKLDEEYAKCEYKSNFAENEITRATHMMEKANFNIEHAETIAERNIKSKYENKISDQENIIQLLMDRLQKQKNHYENRLEKESQQAIKDGFESGIEQAKNDMIPQLDELKAENSTLKQNVKQKDSVIKNKDFEIENLNIELNSTKTELSNEKTRIEKAKKIFKKQKQTIDDLQNKIDIIHQNYKKILDEKDSIIKNLQNKLQNAFVKIKELAVSISSFEHTSEYRQDLNSTGRYILEAIEKNISRYLNYHEQYDLADKVQNNTGLSADIEDDFLEIRHEHNRSRGIER